mmetsp:Transcript_42305/g.103317  ORF Transcript_42305/g.103317 Transcript_42305/m.103317 type:complete len:211 (-) Transcript_42305:11-643(-)
MARNQILIIIITTREALLVLLSAANVLRDNVATHGGDGRCRLRGLQAERVGPPHPLFLLPFEHCHRRSHRSESAGVRGHDEVSRGRAGALLRVDGHRGGCELLRPGVVGIDVLVTLVPRGVPAVVGDSGASRRRAPGNGGGLVEGGGVAPDCGVDVPRVHVVGRVRARAAVKGAVAKGVPRFAPPTICEVERGEGVVKEGEFQHSLQEIG